MAYNKGTRLPGERASKLGHLEVIGDKWVKELIDDFESPLAPTTKQEALWHDLTVSDSQLKVIYGIDGSHQPIISNRPPYKSMMFVKTALLRIDADRLQKVDKIDPHPLMLRDLLKDSALHHSTVFPLKHIGLPGKNTYDAVRYIAYKSLLKLQGGPMETLKWLAYEKWDGKKKSLEPFGCPHCRKEVATLDYDEETGVCPNKSCGGELYVTDMLGFHQEMLDDSASQNVPSSYRAIHETLLLFSGIRYLWENDRDSLSDHLFVKDGPLQIRAQYSKLVAPIRRFLAHAKSKGKDVHIIGQEKTGYFVDHLELIGGFDSKDGVKIFIPDDQYIKKEIQQRPPGGAIYGKDTNYGAKIFIKYGNHHKMVLSIPTYNFQANPDYSDLIGADKIFATLPSLLGCKHENSLLPIELANGIASLSTYPSAKMLQLFAESSGKL